MSADRLYTEWGISRERREFSQLRPRTAHGQKRGERAARWEKGKKEEKKRGKERKKEKRKEGQRQYFVRDLKYRKPRAVYGIAHGQKRGDRAARWEKGKKRKKRGEKREKKRKGKKGNGIISCALSDIANRALSTAHNVNFERIDSALHCTN